MNTLKCKNLADIYSNDVLFSLHFVYLQIFVCALKTIPTSTCNGSIVHRFFTFCGHFFVGSGLNSIFLPTINSIAHVFIHTNKLLQTCYIHMFLTHFKLHNLEQLKQPMVALSIVLLLKRHCFLPFIKIFSC